MQKRVLSNWLIHWKGSVLNNSSVEFNLGINSFCGKKNWCHYLSFIKEGKQMFPSELKCKMGHVWRNNVISLSWLERGKRIKKCRKSYFKMLENGNKNTKHAEENYCENGSHPLVNFWIYDAFLRPPMKHALRMSSNYARSWPRSRRDWSSWSLTNQNITVQSVLAPPFCVFGLCLRAEIER